jgi:hypothetical protein
MECFICCEEINDNNKVITEKDKVYEFCLNCVYHIRDTKINKFIKDFEKEDCLASIKRMIKKGIPFMVDDNKLFIYHKNKNISFLTSTDIIKKIIDLNYILINTLDLNDDFIKDEAIKLIYKTFFS